MALEIISNDGAFGKRITKRQKNFQSVNLVIDDLITSHFTLLNTRPSIYI